MKIGTRLSDLIGIGTGFNLANPDGQILNNVTTLLNTSPIISQSAADEIAKLLAGLVVTLISRWIFSMIEGKKKKKEKVPGPVEDPEVPTPDKITLNKDN